jgi:O-antigen ligase
LWSIALQYLSNRPWQGYGFGAFWNPNRLVEIGNRLGWLSPSAHNGFLDEVLNTGYIGLVLVLAVLVKGMLSGLSWSARRGFQGGALAFSCVFLEILYNLSTSVFQSPLSIPFFVPLIAVFAIPRDSRRGAARRTAAITVQDRVESAVLDKVNPSF